MVSFFKELFQKKSTKSYSIHQPIVCHFVGLRGIGGVQKNFTEYFSMSQEKDKIFKHEVFTIGKVDEQYLPKCIVKNIQNPINLLSFIYRLWSKRIIVHIYNKLTSRAVAYFLFFIPCNNIIVHERGCVWNATKKSGLYIKIISRKASLVLANSFATKAILTERFSVPDNKIKVIHNGIKDYKVNKSSHKRSEFTIGFIGRLDSPKGVHILVEAFKLIPKSQNVKLVIAGDGPHCSLLKQRSSGFDSIEFLGRINDSHYFISGIDLLVVPSIREPLGNVCLEAGLCNTPVIAANVDGLAEIIENGQSGELLQPTKAISLEALPKGSVAVPEFVYDPQNKCLKPPLEVDPVELAKRIIALKNSPDRCLKYSYQLREKVLKHFTLERYITELNSIYLSFI